MAATIAVTAIVATSTAVQAKQQSIATQKQKDAVVKAEDNQRLLMEDQADKDAQRQKKSDAALQQGFAKTAASRTRNYSAAALPGAVAAQSIGSVNPANAGKKLIGS